jgi:hypothetical protein
MFGAFYLETQPNLVPWNFLIEMCYLLILRYLVFLLLLVVVSPNEQYRLTISLKLER